jgi:hypothetical protein
VPKKKLSDLALPLHVVDELSKKCFYVGTPITLRNKNLHVTKQVTIAEKFTCHLIRMPRLE